MSVANAPTALWRQATSFYFDVFVVALFDDVDFPQPESLYDGVGMTHVLPAVENHTDVTAMHADAVCECSLTALTFKGRFE